MVEKKHKILKERALYYQSEEKKSIDLGEHINALQFILSGEKYTIDSSYVSEVILLEDMTSLPCTPDFILGVISVRGKIISVINIKSFFNLPDTGISNLNRVIVVKNDSFEIGILADEIIGNSIIYLDSLQKKIATVTEVPDNFIIGLTDERIIILDIKELLEEEKIIINEEV